MINNRKVSLVLPCRDEAEAIAALFPRIPKQVDEVLVIDNLSKDQTAKVASKLGARVIKETRTDNGVGYGYALANGINNASGDIIVCLDGDGSYPVEKIPAAIRFLLQKKLDFVSCNRVIQHQKKRSQIRALGVKVLNLFTWMLYGYQIKDSLTGMWVFTRQATRELPLYEGGWNFSEEIKLCALVNKNIKFAEFAVPYQDRVFNQSKLNIFQAGTRYWWFLFQYKWDTRKNLVINPQLALLNAVALA